METSESEQSGPLSEPGMLMRRYRTIKDGLVKLEMVTVVGLLIVLYFVLLSQVLFRYVIGSPLIWSEEIARFVFVWIVFLGAAVVAAKNEHIAVTFLAEKLSSRGERYVVRLAALITVCASGILAWSSLSFIAATSSLLSPAVQLPMSWVYVAPLVGFVLIAIHSLEYVVSGEKPSEEAVAAGEGV